MIFEVKERFKLTPNFLASYEGKQPEWGPLGYVTYKRTYSRIKEDGQGEEFWETLQRVVEGCYTIQLNHCKKFNLPWNSHKAQHSAQEMYRRMWDFKFLPPGRGLWMMGTDYVYERGSIALNNCAFLSTEDINKEFATPFTTLMDLSMLGTGVAFDTLGAGKIKIHQPKESHEVFIVEDSKEGWASVIDLVLNAYFGRGALQPVDYSLIRPEGAPIKTFGGIAPGPAPLITCVKELISVLDKRVGDTITSSDIVDLMNIIGKCVVSGGVRRTAELALGLPDDEEYINLKDPKKPELTQWRWSSNNSVLATVGMDYRSLAAQTAKNGEPGYFWLENAQNYGRMIDGFNPDADPYVRGTNPCSEQSLESYEICNLVETFPSRHDSYQDFEKTCKYAYIYAKSVTLVPTHNPRINQIINRNRRIGISQSGIIESFQKHGRREHFNWCDNAYEFIKALDKEYSRGWLGVPVSIKSTTVKPSGSVSLLPGVTPGIHYAHSKYYYRTIRIDKTSSLIEPLKKAGYRVEESVYGDNTWVVYFPVHEENFDRSKTDVSIWEQLENAAQMQYYWSDNQISVTVTFKPEEANQISKALEMYETRLKSVSFLPLTDHEYEQAPYQEIDEAEYLKAVAKLKPLVLVGDTHEAEEKFCTTEACEINAAKKV